MVNMMLWHIITTVTYTFAILNAAGVIQIIDHITKNDITGALLNIIQQNPKTTLILIAVGYAIWNASLIVKYVDLLAGRSNQDGPNNR